MVDQENKAADALLMHPYQMLRIYRFTLSGKGWIRTNEAEATDLQSARFNHLLTCPKIGMTGFEPATSWSQTKRSSQTEPHSVIIFFN